MAVEARTESDTVIAASGERRAYCLLARAQMARRVGVLRRRNAALRWELEEQIKTLRASLASVEIGLEVNREEFAAVALSIQRVAAEAGAIAATQEEMAGLLPSG